MGGGRGGGSWPTPTPLLPQALVERLPVDVALRKADLLVHSIPEVRLQGREILPHGREEAAVHSVHHLQRGREGEQRASAGTLQLAGEAPWTAAVWPVRMSLHWRKRKTALGRPSLEGRGV